MMKVSVVALCLVLGGAVPAVAAGNPFLGVWHVASAKPASWSSGSAPSPKIDKTLAHALIKFGDDSVYGPPPVACRDVHYRLVTVGPDALFGGSLKDPPADAKALGFTSDSILTMSESCEGNASDLSFAMVDHKTVLLSVDNVIYTLKRR